MSFIKSLDQFRVFLTMKSTTTYFTVSVTCQLFTIMTPQCLAIVCKISKDQEFQIQYEIKTKTTKIIIKKYKKKKK